MFDGQLPAGALDDFHLRNGFQELKAETECVPLPHQRMDYYFAGRDGELEPDDLPYAHFIAQHYRHSRFAEVDRMPAYDLRIARVDADTNFNLVARMAARFDHCLIPLLVRFPQTLRLKKPLVDPVQALFLGLGEERIVLHVK